MTERIDERNTVNLLSGLDTKIEQISMEQKMLRVQIVGLLAGLMLLGVGLYKLGGMVTTK